jgi:glycosyltransferase involved in cell wall biosynthesis
VRVLVVTVVHVPTDTRIAARQIRSMVDAGWEVTYAAPWSDYDLAASGAGFSPIDLPRAVGRSRLRALRVARRLIAEKAASHDLVMIHDPDLLLAVVGGQVGVPVVWDVHEDTAAALGDRPWVPEWARPLAVLGVRRAEAWAERNLHLILAEDAYVERFSRAHPVVPNYPRVPDQVALPGRDRLVYVGRVSRLRGALELVELGCRLHGEIDVEIVGPADPDVEPQLRRARERGHITWTGYLPTDEAMSRLDGALAGLSLFHDEPNARHSMPTKVLEYAAHGLPVITTPLPLAEQFVERSTCGYIVDFGDLDAVVAAVREMREDDERRRWLGRGGHLAVREGFSWQRIEDQFLDHLRGWAGWLDCV